MTSPVLLLACCLIFVSLAAVWDLRTGTIPNYVSLGALGAGLALHVAVHVVDLWSSTGFGAVLAGVFDALLGIVLCGLPPYLLFRVDAMGGGDVKLLAAVGAFAGPTMGLELQLSAFIVMALFAPARLAYEGKLLAVLGNTLVLVANPFLPRGRKRELPRELLTPFKFGPAVLVANVVVLLAHWVQR
jgi:prepilin peptidase CpaA